MWNIALICLLGLAGCHGYRATAYGPVHRVGYIYQRQDDGTVTIFAQDGNALAKALIEVGCGKAYICLMQREGDIYSVVQRKK